MALAQLRIEHSICGGKSSSRSFRPFTATGLMPGPRSTESSCRNSVSKEQRGVKKDKRKRTRRDGDRRSPKMQTDHHAGQMPMRPLPLRPKLPRAFHRLREIPYNAKQRLSSAALHLPPAPVLCAGCRSYIIGIRGRTAEGGGRDAERAQGNGTPGAILFRIPTTVRHRRLRDSVKVFLGKA